MIMCEVGLITVIAHMVADCVPFGPMLFPKHDIVESPETKFAPGQRKKITLKN